MTSDFTLFLVVHYERKKRCQIHDLVGEYGLYTLVEHYSGTQNAVVKYENSSKNYWNFKFSVEFFALPGKPEIKATQKQSIFRVPYS